MEENREISRLDREIRWETVCLTAKHWELEGLYSSDSRKFSEQHFKNILSSQGKVTVADDDTFVRLKCFI